MSNPVSLVTRTQGPIRAASRLWPVLILLLLAVLLPPAPAHAQGLRPEAPPSPPHGGVAELPFELGSLFAPEDLEVEINLGPWLLRMVAAATREEDDEFSRLLSGLQEIRVRIAKPEAAARRDLVERLHGAVQNLDRKGWQPVVRVSSAGDESYIYVAEKDGRIGGLVVLFSNSGGQAGLIHIAGELDPADLGRIGQQFNLPLPDPAGKPPGAGAPKAPPPPPAAKP
jgi:hypothetical protein